MTNISNNTLYETINIETIDQAINDFFDVTVDAHVNFPNGERKKVPVSFKAGERAIVSRQKKGIRDKNGVLVLPLINISRISIEPNPTMQALGTETSTLQISKVVSGETNNLRNVDKLRTSSLSVPPIVYEITTIPFPDRSIMNYQLKIQTQYTLQMNEILEKIFNQLDLQKSFVATFIPRKHPQIGVDFEKREKTNSGYVVGFLDSTLNDTGNLQEFTDQERIITYETTIKVPATLQLDPEGEKPVIQKEYTAYKVDFRDENICFFNGREDFELAIRAYIDKNKIIVK